MVHCVYTFSGALVPDRILPGAKFTLRLSLAFSYIGSVTVYCTALQQRPSAKLCGVVQGMELRNFAEGAPIFGRAAITLSIGPIIVD